jgi:hypothetical protein
MAFQDINIRAVIQDLRRVSRVIADVVRALAVTVARPDAVAAALVALLAAGIVQHGLELGAARAGISVQRGEHRIDIRESFVIQNQTEAVRLMPEHQREPLREAFQCRHKADRLLGGMYWRALRKLARLGLLEQAAIQ